MKKRAIAFSKKAWAIWFAFNFLLFFLILFPLFLITLLIKPLHRYAHSLRGIWGAIIMFNTGLRGRVTYDEKLDKRMTYIFVPNHSSYLDILSLCVNTPFYFNFMAKEELARIPLFGIFFRTIDIAVDRKSTIKAHKAFKVAAGQLKEGKSIVIFPEGTISKIAPRLSKFKPGAFRLALDTGVSLVPVTIMDNWERLPDKKGFQGTAGRMRMHIHRPIPTSHLKSSDEQNLKDEVFRIIENKLIESGVLSESGHKLEIHEDHRRDRR